MEITRLAKTFFISSSLFFLPLVVHAESANGLYMNGQWDNACSKCWSSPHTDKNNHCKPTDCAVQGFYHCKMQNPPLEMDDDPRLIPLIKSGQCTYAPMTSLNEGESDYIKSLNYCMMVLDKMAGRYIVPANTDNESRNRIDFYLTQFKASFLGSSADQIKLAIDYDTGTGTSQNRTRATEIYHSAAAKGAPFAQYALAARYAYGISMPKDRTLAIRWLNKAITNKPRTQADLKSQQMVTPCAIKLIERLTPS